MTQHQTQRLTSEESTDAEKNEGEDDDEAQSTDRYETRPTIKPPVIWTVVTVVLGGILMLLSFLTGFGLDDQGIASVIGLVIAFITVLLVIRYLVTIFLLTRTTYTVTPTEIRHEFSLWLKTKSREIPIEQIRGQELEQDVLQRTFGVGTISVLTGGTNSSLGYVTFENVPNPQRVNERIQDYRDAYSN